MRLENEIRVKRHGEVTVVDIRGDITSYSETPLRDAYRQDVARDTRNIIFAIEKDAYINSGGIALLIQLLYQTRENKQNVALVGVSRHYKKIFNMVGITKFAKIYDTFQCALETLESKPESCR
jgi:anti-anti-sigma factor